MSEKEPENKIHPYFRKEFINTIRSIIKGGSRFRARQNRHILPEIEPKRTKNAGIEKYENEAFLDDGAILEAKDNNFDNSSIKKYTENHPTSELKDYVTKFSKKVISAKNPNSAHQSPLQSSFSAKQLKKPILNLFRSKKSSKTQKPKITLSQDFQPQTTARSPSRAWRASTSTT